MFNTANLRLCSLWFPMCDVDQHSKPGTTSFHSSLQIIFYMFVLVYKFLLSGQMLYLKSGTSFSALTLSALHSVGPCTHFYKAVFSQIKHFCFALTQKKIAVHNHSQVFFCCSLAAIVHHSLFDLLLPL